WLDRAVLHFLTTDKEVEFYVRNVNKAVKIGGYAFFAEFSKTGATKCAGLNVRRYDINDLKRNLPSFELVKSEEFTYINPVGSERPYVYALFKRIEK
ncbi:MAG: methyltransferase type 12, partial [bacterium]|nr:methyltransferase type 12 [bacterium]